ncbi:MAG: serine hydrolase [Gemmatimonadales bacterium]|nr:serine hydrolase [Gemmatimonadales bacterium]NIN12575.1 serine hydrolase [Gemmatimonadales bacterium]NIR03570.1 serine hydrolase [Gemmatimonadales bacterium]NIS65892.1 serine hydrolase [Gemmatimonadales bacterium]
MRHTTRSLSWALLVGALTPPLHAQVVPTHAGDTRLSQYEAAIARGRIVAQAIVNDVGVPGLSVSVGVDGKVVWSEGFGFADLELMVPVTPQTRMRIGSVSKPVAATAAIRADSSEATLCRPLLQRGTTGTPCARSCWRVGSG